jgi:mycothiol synthase
VIATGPLGPADLDEVLAVWVACEEHDDGAAEVSRADLVAMTGRPSFDFARDTAGVREDGALVAFGAQIGKRLTFAHVLPGARGRGNGAWLLGWAEGAARAIGASACSQSLSEHDAAARALLGAHGYEERWEEWSFTLALDAEPESPALPAGYAIRPFGPGDERAAYDVIDRAFAEWPDREGGSFEDWSASSLGRPGFEPSLLALAVRGDEVAGALLLVIEAGEGWVDQLAVARQHRGRGLARALLQHAFAETWRRGLRRAGLATDSRTGARGLYEHLGMHVRKTFGEFTKPL